jgi:ketosteroid isomerase-like protein
MNHRETAEERELNALIERWAQAIREGNLEAVLAFHEDDVVLFDVAAPVEHRGLAPFRKAWAPFLSGGPHEVFELGGLQLHVSGDVAFAHALLRIEADKDFSVRLTVGFRKRADRWVIVHEHHSAPL